jgi:hypothetical protein
MHLDFPIEGEQQHCRAMTSATPVPEKKRRKFNAIRAALELPAKTPPNCGALKSRGALLLCKSRVEGFARLAGNCVDQEETC